MPQDCMFAVDSTTVAAGLCGLNHASPGGRVDSITHDSGRHPDNTGAAGYTRTHVPATARRAVHSILQSWCEAAALRLSERGEDWLVDLGLTSAGRKTPGIIIRPNTAKTLASSVGVAKFGAIREAAMRISESPSEAEPAVVRR